eukprot:gene13637-19519_t
MHRNPRFSPAGKAPERSPVQVDHRRTHPTRTSVSALSSRKDNGASRVHAEAQSVASSASHVASAPSAPAPAPAPGPYPPSSSSPPPAPTRYQSQSGGLSRDDFFKFVQFFRQASPYIEGHRGRTFVIVLPGTVTSDPKVMRSVMSDIALLHGLGVQVVIIPGTGVQIDEALIEKNMKPMYIHGYRITSRETMKVVIEAAGNVRTACEQYLSKGPAIPMIRRHTKGDGEIHFQPALRVVSGNYITTKRRGIIDGIDYGCSGEVRFVLKNDIKQQLINNNIVLLSNLGFTAAGEVLNCNSYEIGLHTAVGLQADKLIFMHKDKYLDELPTWLPISSAQDMLLDRLKVPLPSSSPQKATPTERVVAAQRLLATKGRDDIINNLDIWSVSGFPEALSTCVVACQKGVKRAHLLPADMDGSLLLSLYSRDGAGTMISTDFFEDLDGIQLLLAPLENAGVFVKRSRDDLDMMLPEFIVIERECKLLGCALLVPLGTTDDGTTVAEIGAFCIDPSVRGSGRGDSMLDYVEQEARRMGIRRLVLLTTRTADWFEQREFILMGPAADSEFIPSTRRLRIKRVRNSQLFAKDLEAAQPTDASPGKRIGF